MLRFVIVKRHFINSTIFVNLICMSLFTSTMQL